VPSPQVLFRTGDAEVALERQPMIRTLQGGRSRGQWHFLCRSSGQGWSSAFRFRQAFPLPCWSLQLGYGKSVGASPVPSQFATAVRAVRLRTEHATLLSFLRGFAEALGESAPHATTALAGAYQRNHASPKRGSDLARWMNVHLESFSGVVAIDDLQIADDDPEIARFLTALIEGKQRAHPVDFSPPDRRLGFRLEAGSPIAMPTWRSTNTICDLRFEEAAAAARDLGLRSVRMSSAIARPNEGWPAAMSFALRTSTRSSDLRNVSAVTREMIYRFLAEQVYGTLDDEERSLLEVAMALPT